MNEKQLQFVTFEQAVKLKRIGFDLEVNAFYTQGILDDNFKLLDKCERYDNFNAEKYHRGNRPSYSAPTVALALKFIEQEKRIKTSVELVYKFGGIWVYQWKILIGSDCHISKSHYEEKDDAESALLDEVLKLEI